MQNVIFDNANIRNGSIPRENEIFFTFNELENIFSKTILISF